MDTTWKKTQHVRLHAPLSTHGTIWDMTSIPFGTGNSMIPSVASDGSVLMVCSGDCTHGKFRPPPLQLFRIIQVASAGPPSSYSSEGMEAAPSGSEGSGSSSGVATEARTHAAQTLEATLIVDCSIAPITPEPLACIHPPPLAIHRVTACPGTLLSKSSYCGKSKLVAYGGAAGLVRVHMVHQDLFGQGTTKDLFL
jgi:hypothetical protein